MNATFTVFDSRGMSKELRFDHDNYPVREELAESILKCNFVPTSIELGCLVESVTVQGGGAPNPTGAVGFNLQKSTLPGSGFVDTGVSLTLNGANGLFRSVVGAPAGLIAPVYFRLTYLNKTQWSVDVAIWQLTLNVWN